MWPWKIHILSLRSKLNKSDHKKSLLVLGYLLSKFQNLTYKEIDFRWKMFKPVGFCIFSKKYRTYHKNQPWEVLLTNITRYVKIWAQSDWWWLHFCCWRNGAQLKKIIVDLNMRKSFLLFDIEGQNLVSIMQAKWNQHIT